MAVGAQFVRNRSLEIPIRVALHAPDLLVLSFQCKMRLGVIEGHSKRRLLPRHCRVTGIAPLLERPLMRVCSMTVSAIRKRQPCVFWLSTLRWSMAAFA